VDGDVHWRQGLEYLLAQEDTQLLGLVVRLGGQQSPGKITNAVVVADLLQTRLEQHAITHRSFHAQTARNRPGMDGERDRDVLHRGPQLAQDSDGTPDSLTHLWLHQVCVQLFPHDAYPETCDVAVQRLDVRWDRDVPGVGIFGVVARDGFQGERTVCHTAGQWPQGIHRPDTRHEAIATDSPPRGP